MGASFLNRCRGRLSGTRLEPARALATRRRAACSAPARLAVARSPPGRCYRRARTSRQASWLSPRMDRTASRSPRSRAASTASMSTSQTHAGSVAPSPPYVAGRVCKCRLMAFSPIQAGLRGNSQETCHQAQPPAKWAVPHTQSATTRRAGEPPAPGLQRGRSLFGRGRALRGVGRRGACRMILVCPWAPPSARGRPGRRATVEPAT